MEVQANVDVEVQADAEPFQSEGMVSVAFYSSDPSSNWKQLDLKKFQLSNKKDEKRVRYDKLNKPFWVLSRPGSGLKRL